MTLAATLVLSACNSDGDEIAAPSREGVTFTLDTERTVCATDDWSELGSVEMTAPSLGQPIWLTSRTTALRSPGDDPDTDNVLDAMRVACTGGDSPSAYDNSTRNHRGSDSPDQSSPGLREYVHFLYYPTAGDDITCTLWVKTYVSTGAGCLTYQAGATKTFLRSAYVPGGLVWGTDSDATHSTTGQTLIGGGLMRDDAHVLAGPRFRIPPSASSIDVYSDIEMTSCYEGDDTDCAIYSDGAWNASSSHVTATLHVQQMKDDVSSEVCHDTISHSDVVIDSNSHHQKVYLLAPGVSFRPVCDDRSAALTSSFLVESEVRWISGNLVKIEPGLSDGHGGFSSGYSLSIVIENP